MNSEHEESSKFTVTDKGTEYSVPYINYYALLVEAISLLSNRVAVFNVQTKFRADEGMWPPDKPKIFMPLLMIHHKGQHTMKQTVKVGNLVQKSDIQNTQNITKEMMDILAPLENNNEPQFIMIDGAPGIGKSVLLCEIAFMWGKQKILKDFKLALLLCLRDPNVQKATSVNHLLQVFSEGDEKVPEITKLCCDYVFKTGGKEVILLLDGYDELPVKLQANSLIAKILKRQLLPKCGLIVSSRPQASVTLREQATITVDILGFNEDEKYQYIEHSLKGQPQCVEKLIHYLKDHPTISNLCMVPFNIVILLYLYKMDIPLPSDTSKLYHHFISLTICQHLAKSGYTFENIITDLARTMQ